MAAPDSWRHAWLGLCVVPAGVIGLARHDRLGDVGVAGLRAPSLDLVWRTSVGAGRLDLGMPPILNAQGVSKRFGAVPLFEEISFPVSEGDRVGLIGPNGAGKSTLLAVLAGEQDPDAGEVAVRKRARIGYIKQESNFAAGLTVRDVLVAALERAGVPDAEREGRLRETSGRIGFPRLEDEAAALSGGWRKRLAIAEAVVTGPDVLLLDEPTNHLDLAGIVWLEGLLKTAPFACVIVSHDRYFLENVATEMVELSRVYADGLLRVKGSYSKFLEGREQYLEAQTKLQDALKNRVKTEIEWLRRGPKARATKAKARIDNAHELIGQLKEVNARQQTSSAGIEFSATERQTKRLVELERCVVAGWAGDSGEVVDAGYEWGAGGAGGSEREWEDDAAAAVDGRACADEWGGEAGGVSADGVFQPDAGDG